MGKALDEFIGYIPVWEFKDRIDVNLFKEELFSLWKFDSFSSMIGESWVALDFLPE